jgi:hypothetical protein
MFAMMQRAVGRLWDTAKEALIANIKNAIEDTKTFGRTEWTKFKRSSRRGRRRKLLLLEFIHWLTNPAQIGIAAHKAGAVTSGLLRAAFILAGTLFYAWPLLFWGTWYEEHKWIVIPEPHRTIFLIFYFSLGGFWLYVLRCRARVIYGFVEVIAAVATFYFTVVDRFPQQNAQSTKDFSLAWIQIAAGLYIFVRGLDNIGQGLAPGSWVHGIWQNSPLFQKPPRV